MRTTHIQSLFALLHRRRRQRQYNATTLAQRLRRTLRRSQKLPEIKRPQIRLIHSRFRPHMLLVANLMLHRVQRVAVAQRCAAAGAHHRWGRRRCRRPRSNGAGLLAKSTADVDVGPPPAVR